MSTATTVYLEDLLHHDIPLTRAIGLQVVAWDNAELQLRLPLQPNLNHANSMFGGSLYCGAVLAGWGWLLLSLREQGIEDGHIVIQHGHIDYSLPVTEDVLVSCAAPPVEAWQRFLALYRRKGLARLVLESRIEQAGQSAMHFQGHYVLQRNTHNL